MVGTLVSFWEGPFSGAMLVLGRVRKGKITPTDPEIIRQKNLWITLVSFNFLHPKKFFPPPFFFNKKQITKPVATKTRSSWHCFGEEDGCNTTVKPHGRVGKMDPAGGTVAGRREKFLLPCRGGGKTHPKWWEIWILAEGFRVWRFFFCFKLLGFLVCCVFY